MIHRLLADGVVLVHFAFILFVLLGGFLVWRRPRVAWLHLPALFYGAAVEFGGWICPLTPLENRFRAAAGRQPYDGGFIEHYLLPVIYPEGLTREIQIGLGSLVLVVNLVVYGRMLLQRHGRCPAGPERRHGPRPRRS